jgi:hypothetical protein
VLFIVSIAVALLFFICGSRKFGMTYRPWDWLPRADIVGHTCALPSSLLFAPVSDPRRILHFDVTELREAFPFDQLPRYLLRDRDGNYPGLDYLNIYDYIRQK